MTSVPRIVNERPRQSLCVASNDRARGLHIEPSGVQCQLYEMSWVLSTLGDIEMIVYGGRLDCLPKCSDKLPRPSLRYEEVEWINSLHQFWTKSWQLDGQILFFYASNPSHQQHSLDCKFMIHLVHNKIWWYHFQGFCAISIYSNIQGEVVWFLRCIQPLYTKSSINPSNSNIIYPCVVSFFIWIVAIIAW